MGLAFTVLPVAQLGTRQTVAHVNRGPGRTGFERIEVPVYPPSPRGLGLAEARKDVSMGLRQAADLLGLAPVDLSGLEHGRAVLGSDNEWARALQIIQQGCRCDPADRTGGGHDPKCPEFDPNAGVEPVQW